MNNKGQVIFLGLMLGIVIVVLALAFAPGLRQFSDTARNESTDTTVGLNCTSTDISDYDKATCVVTDLSLPYFILGLIGIGLIVITAKIVFGGSG